jgi:hypothetical protein
MIMSTEKLRIDLVAAMMLLLLIIAGCGGGGGSEGGGGGDQREADSSRSISENQNTLEISHRHPDGDYPQIIAAHLDTTISRGHILTINYSSFLIRIFSQIIKTRIQIWDGLFASAQG